MVSWAERRCRGVFASFRPDFVREKFPFGVEIVERDLCGEMFSFRWSPINMDKRLVRLGSVATLVY